MHGLDPEVEVDPEGAALRLETPVLLQLLADSFLKGDGGDVSRLPRQLCDCGHVTHSFDLSLQSGMIHRLSQGCRSSVYKAPAQCLLHADDEWSLQLLPWLLSLLTSFLPVVET